MQTWIKRKPETILILESADRRANKITKDGEGHSLHDNKFTKI